MEKLEQESKYYTPSIEEFFIGFECEFASYISNDPHNRYSSVFEGWRDCKIGSRHSIPDTAGLEMYRVKLLDSQDIIDCGFELRHGDHTFYYFTDNLYTEDKIDKVMFELVKANNGKYLISKGCYFNKAYPPCGDITLFYGTIKNKQELKKILQQIGVL